MQPLEEHNIEPVKASFLQPTNDQKLQYIGHTKRKLRKRVQEHETSCKGDLSNFQPNDVQDSGIPFHYASTGENFKFEETKILEREKNNFKRKILESIHISNKIDSLVNLKLGMKLNPAWSPIIKDLRLPWVCQAVALLYLHLP